MHQKALCCGDAATAAQVMENPDPKTVKWLGRAITPYDEEAWRAERQERKAARSEKRAGRQTLEVDPNGLYAALKSLRAELAQKEGVPAFVIFSNATLEDMTRRCPRTEKEFMAVSGVGQYKASRYAEEFLAAISDWEARRN